MRFLYLLLALMLASPAHAAIIPSIPYNLTNGSLADATQVMGNFNTIVTDVNTNAAKSGANSDITSITGLTTPLASAFGGTAVYTGGTTAGTANTQTLITVVPSNFTLTAGNIVTGVASASNTGAMTLNVNSTGAIAVCKGSSSGLTPLVGNEVINGQAYMWLYDGTYFELLNPTALAAGTLSVSGGGTGQTSLTANNVILGNGTSAVQFVAPGTSGNVLTSNGTTWQSTASHGAWLRRTVYSSGSGTWARGTGTVSIYVKAWGGGGGLTGNGGDTTFDTLTAGGGFAPSGATPGAGGTSSGGDINAGGGAGGSTDASGLGGFGGSAAMGGGGGAGANGGFPGGGAGGTTAGSASSAGGAGYTEKFYTAPSSASYSVGAGGSGSKTGGSGAIVVDEYN